MTNERNEREATLQEWVERLPKYHFARREYDQLLRDLAESHARGNRLIDGFKRFWYRKARR